MSENNSLKILVVDDLSSMRTLLKGILKNIYPGVVTIEAENGLDAVKKYQEFKPDLVTMDVQMPKADGIQALRAILKLDPKARVVMITVKSKGEIGEDTVRLGAVDYIVKPFDPRLVYPILARALNSIS